MTACPVDDRLALQDLTIAFAHATDSMHDVDSIAACFTEDAVYDLSSIGMGSVVGRAGIRDLYTGFFAANAHHAHFLSNFAVTAYGGETASVRTYVTGMARSKQGADMVVHGRYYFDAVRIGQGWQFARYSMDVLIPPAG